MNTIFNRKEIVSFSRLVLAHILFKIKKRLRINDAKYGCCAKLVQENRTEDK
tara:strand:- start:1395 stop:1550 length:156 start_codon:yes stop_codon:yes gene_type:complete